MTERIILLSLAILPVICLAYFVYRKDKFEKEPIRMLLKAFFFGCISAIPAIFLESMLTYSFISIGGNEMSGIIQGLWNGYAVAGCSEEFCKLILLALAVWKSREFNEYFDGIVYATFVSLGFAALENVMYVFDQESFYASFVTGSMRAVLSVPGHFLFGVAMGYYFALAKFQPERRLYNLFMAFLIPMLLHGTFDALLMIPESMGEEYSWLSGILFPVFIWFDIRLWKIGMRKLGHLQQLSEEQYGDSFENNTTTQMQDPFSNFKWDV